MKEHCLKKKKERRKIKIYFWWTWTELTHAALLRINLLIGKCKNWPNMCMQTRLQKLRKLFEVLHVSGWVWGSSLQPEQRRSHLFYACVDPSGQTAFAALKRGESEHQLASEARRLVDTEKLHVVAATVTVRFRRSVTCFSFTKGRLDQIQTITLFFETGKKDGYIIWW